MAEEEIKGKKSAKPVDCQSCPIAKALGMCDGMRSLLTDVDCGEFLAHFSNARRELLLGVKSLLDEAIDLEEGKAEKHKEASTGKKKKKKPSGEKLKKIDIE